MTSSRELGISALQRWCHHIWGKWIKATSTFGADQGSMRQCSKCKKWDYK